MLTTEQYLEPARHYRGAAQVTQDNWVKNELSTLAESYTTLARSTYVLERSTGVVANIDQRRK
jgi:hypothetical protein